MKDGDPLPGKGRDVVPPAAVLVLETPGGGGIGPATERDPAAVAADVDAGLISPEAARNLYGWEPDPTE